MSLKTRLENFKADFLKQVPSEIADVMSAETDKLKAEDFLKNVPKNGETLLDGTLTTGSDKKSVYTALEGNKPYIISFYRGGWCPYCRLELEALEEIYSEVKALGGEIIAITPEDQAEVANTREKTGVSFEIYSDTASEYAKSLSLAHTLPKSLQEIYLGFGVNVEKHNGESLFDLPIPATLVINKDKSIEYVFVDGDYTERSNPEELLATLKRINQ